MVKAICWPLVQPAVKLWAISPDCSLAPKQPAPQRCQESLASTFRIIWWLNLKINNGDYLLWKHAQHHLHQLNDMHNLNVPQGVQTQITEPLDLSLMQLGTWNVKIHISSQSVTKWPCSEQWNSHFIRKVKRVFVTDGNFLLFFVIIITIYTNSLQIKQRRALSYWQQA